MNAQPQEFYTYIIQSDKDGSHYIGYTQNLEQRLEKHNNARSGYTSTKQPWKMVYHENFDNKTEALQRERFLKKQKNKSFYERLITKFKIMKLIIIKISILKMMVTL